MNDSFGKFFQIMSDQPDTCGKCGCRLELVDIVQTADGQVFASWYEECQREVLIVES